MDAREGWTPLNVPEMAALPRPVFPRSENLAPRRFFPDHVHPWRQLVYATAGTLVTATAGARYVVGREQALWIPAGLAHSTGAPFGAEFRNLYVAADVGGDDLPAECVAFAVTPLLRALIVELDAATARDEPPAYLASLEAVTLEQLRRQPRVDFCLPWPQSRALQTLCEALYADPGDSRGVAEWGRKLGASTRTLNRRFESELGVTFRDWRQQLRLLRALEWLEAGRSVTDVALALGYASPSAFTYMFRRKTGRPPAAARRP